MNSNPSLDPESFEALLANAFEVQRSGLDPRSLSAVIDVQRFIATPEFSGDRGLRLIADCALKVANASGIAIALLESNQLVYRAGSGSAAIQVGRHVPAVLAARSEAQAEILRVENAENDSRVQADICKQFGAMSLLILPIYKKLVIAGVLQVHFNEAHVFLDPEVRAYRLMAGLVEEAMSRNLEHATTEVPALSVAPAIESNPDVQPVLIEDSERPTKAEPAFFQFYSEPAGEQRVWFNVELARQFGQKVNRLFTGSIWPLAATVSAVPLLAVAIQIAHHHHSVPSKVSTTYSSRPDTAAQKLLPTPANATSGETSNSGTKRPIAPRPAFRRVQVGPNEVDYVAEDVTIRDFTNRHARPQTRITDRQVDIGQDVTIRYFSRKSSSDTQPVPVPASQTATQSLSR